MSALAATFESRAHAMFPLRQASLPPELFSPFDAAPHLRAYWSEVGGRQLELGRAPGGRQRLLGAAAKEYPAHPVLGKGTPPSPRD